MIRTLYNFYSGACHGFSHLVETNTPDLSQENIANIASQMIIAHQKERTIKPGINQLILAPFLKMVLRTVISIASQLFIQYFLKQILDIDMSFVLNSTTPSLIYQTFWALFIIPFFMENLMIDETIHLILSLDPAEFIFLWITGETTIFSRNTKKFFVKVTFPILIIIHLFFREKLITWIGTFLVNKFAQLLYHACFLKAGAVFKKEYNKWMELPNVKLHASRIEIKDSEYKKSHLD